MRINLIILILLLLTLFSCQKIERNNPFDPECPRQLWTPSNFQAVQEGNAIKLTWNVPVTNISGFKVYRQINYSGNFLEIKDMGKDISQWIDTEIVGGKVHLYSIVAYAGNNESNAGSAQITPKLLASVVTTVPSSITATSANLGGTITSDGGSQVTERGICWAVSANPTITNTKAVIGIGVGSFNKTVMSFTTNTLYYVRAYALNGQGVSYGKEESFITKGDGTATDIDGNIYHTVAIGTQVWMVENLKATKFRNGDPIPYYSQTSSSGYCWYNHDASYKNIYGAIYNYYTISDPRSICPLGWHIPSVEEWTILINYLGGENVAGGKLKEAGISHWKSPNIGATNSYGFTALPGGGRDCSNTFVNLGSVCQLWTSLKVAGGMVQGISIDTNSGKLLIGNKGYDCNSIYVRCIKD